MRRSRMSAWSWSVDWARANCSARNSVQGWSVPALADPAGNPRFSYQASARRRTSVESPNQPDARATSRSVRSSGERDNIVGSMRAPRVEAVNGLARQGDQRLRPQPPGWLHRQTESHEMKSFDAGHRDLPHLWRQGTGAGGPVQG